MSENLIRIDGRLNKLWSDGEFNTAYEVIVQELVPVLQDYLVGGGFGHQDAQDIVGDALLGFSKKISEHGPRSVYAPKAYIWLTMVRGGRLRKKKNLQLPIPESKLARPNADGEYAPPHDFLDNQLHTGVGSDLAPIWLKRAIYLIEGAIGDIEIADSDAVPLVRETLKCLSSISTDALKYVLFHGPQKSKEAAAHFGIKPGTFRARKMRAYAQFRTTAIKVGEELGIQWRGVTDDLPGFEPDREQEWCEDTSDDQSNPM
jgi:DNA-directed RNA polymerase specialized sigma24 family protein